MPMYFIFMKFTPQQANIKPNKERTPFMDNVLANHIEKTPGKCGGQACLVGHRIRVADIVVWHEKRGYCPDEIVHLFPGITLADVYAALTYYFDNRDDIVADLRQSEKAAEWARANLPTKIPTEYRERNGG